jgi:hypothetical protein
MTFNNSFQFYNGAGDYYYLFCFELMSPPTGSQTISLTSTGSGTHYTNGNSASYLNVTSVATAVGNFGTTSPATLSMTGTVTGQIEAMAAAFASSGSGQTFSTFTQTQRYLAASGSASDPLLIGEAAGNGGTVSFSATESTSRPWGTLGVTLV